MLIYGDTVLSTKDPNPSRKFLVIVDISIAEKRTKVDRIKYDDYYILDNWEIDAVFKK